MQIRTRANNIEFLRGTWDPEKKRTVQKLIKPPEFSESEKAQYAAYAAEKKVVSDALRDQYTAQTLAQAIERAIAGIDAGAMPDEPERLLQALDQLRGRLRKAGIKRTPKIAEVAPDSRQGKLTV
jgi:2-methylisocitrate lyase-like PEP mutase family enzyme